MVRDFNVCLQSEMQLLRTALERLDAELGDRIILALEPDHVQAIAAELDGLAQTEALPDALVELLRIIRTVPQ